MLLTRVFQVRTIVYKRVRGEVKLPHSQDVEMKLKNYQEDIVLSLIPVVLEDRPDLNADDATVHDATIHDVAAYVLNRIPPRYIVSERGFTRIASESWFMDDPDGSELTRELIPVVELLILINRAVDVVTRRRTGLGDTTAAEAEPLLSPDGELLYWHSFPQVVGRAVDKHTHDPIIGAAITLHIDADGPASSEVGWHNPYHTNEGTRGYYSFWPKSVQRPAEKHDFRVTLTFDHPDYDPYEYVHAHASQTSYATREDPRMDRVINLGSCLLTRKTPA